MITLNLDWREVLWWLKGGMTGSHNCWDVYEDMVDRVWPQCSEQDRRNMFLIMRRYLGSYWRPEGWQGLNYDKPGEGPWREDIFDRTPWEYFRKVLARFDPDNQYEVTMKVTTREAREELQRMGLAKSASKGTFRIRAYRWPGPDGSPAYFIDWHRRCDPAAIVMTEKLTIHDTGEI